MSGPIELLGSGGGGGGGSGLTEAEIKELLDEEVAELDTIESGLTNSELKVPSSALIALMMKRKIPILEGGVQLGAAAGANSYGIVPNFSAQSNLTGNIGHGIKFLDPAFWAVPGLKTKYMVQFSADVNTKAPGINIKVELRKVTETAGGTAVNGIAASEAVAGLNAVVEKPAAKSLNHAESAATDAPAAGHFDLVVVTTEATAAESLTDIRATLYAFLEP